jgi:hypothetical protein
MQLLRKKFVLESLDNITVDFIEKFIEGLGYKPLRWAVVERKENQFIIDAVIVN